MNALNFYADIEKEKGTAYVAEETAVHLESVYDNKRRYCHIHYDEGNRYYAFEYLTLTLKDDKKYLGYYMELESGLEELSVEQQYKILKQMETIEIEYSPNPVFDDLNDWYLHDASIQKYPLFSLRGTCNVENNCNCDCSCGNIHGIPCCSNRMVGCSDTSIIKHPDYTEILTYLVLWMASCPSVEALYVMHDHPPVFLKDVELVFEFAFLLKNKKITYIEDENEVKRLYLEYNEKYPCDTSKVEDMMNGWYDNVPDFHF